MSVSNLELHGIDAPLDEEIVLKAGPFEAIFEPARAYLRRIRINGVESVRNVYVHARGPSWETVLPAVTMGETKIGTDHFELTWKAVHRQSGIDFEWEGTLTGSPTGIVYRCDGVAVREFKTNRTGLCLLIPREFQGHTAHIVHTDVSTSAVYLPTYIAPSEPMRDIQSVEIGPVKLTFEGDRFEAEDQRNWTDASFKAYSLRGRRQPAYSLSQGERVMHAVRIDATGEVPIPRGEMTRPVLDRNVIRLPESHPTPMIGARVTNDHGELGNLPVDFLRVEVTDDDFASDFLLLHARAANLPVLIRLLAGGRKPDVRANETLIINGVNGRPAELQPVLFGGGSFDSFNGAPRAARGFDGVEVSVSPQVHTFDERSILENAATLVDVLRTLGAFAPGAQFCLDVHLRTDGPEPRLGSLFGALWMLRSYAAASEFGPCSITLASVDEIRDSTLSALLQELTGKLRYKATQTESSAEIVVLEAIPDGKAILVGNLLRTPRELRIAGKIGGIKRLSRRGWIEADFGMQPILDPYEIVAFASMSGNLTIE